jgi:hypothetical protein
MNERIKLLAEQATTYIEPTANSGEGWIFDKEKFAELIVQECNRYACSAWEHGPLLGRDLLIHFGIVRLNDE